LYSYISVALGAAGAQGPRGLDGAAGAPGRDGAAGTNGGPGTNGTDGAPGESVAGSSEPAGPNCAYGGAKFVAGSSVTYACNGAPGATGPQGGGGGDPTYQLACAAGLSNVNYPFCCRLNSITGQVSCVISQTVGISNWSAAAEPFAAAVDGHYSLACFSGWSGINFPVCCRSDAAGNASCRIATGTALSSWSDAASF
jgi:hypothetical protein